MNNKFKNTKNKRKRVSSRRRFDEDFEDRYREENQRSDEYSQLSKNEIAQIKRNKRIREVFFVNIFLFITLAIYYVFMILNHKDIAYSAYNSRTTKDNTAVWRGQILSSDERTSDSAVLAITEEDGYRSYPEGEAFAHVVGYYDYGRTGIENIYGVEMESVNFELFKYFAHMFGAELNGNNVVTTLDADLQNFVYETMGNQKGAVVVLDAKTGDILSMVSTPSFDPNNIEQNWDYISTDEENTPLLNRAIQGQYPPGSTFKIVTALSFMRNDPNYASYTHDCTGSITIEDTTITCYNSEVHGVVDLEEAIKVSCNTYFVSLVNELKPKELEKTANDLRMNDDLDFILPYKNSSFGFTEEDDMSVYMRTYIGQGNTLVTPLYMAQLFQAIANDGKMMEPHIIDRVESPAGLTVDAIRPRAIDKVMTKEEADILTGYMKNVTKAGGTASSLESLPFEVAGKTGSAENPHGADHGWFVGFAPADDPQVVVSVLYENNSGSHYLMSDVKAIFEQAVVVEN